MLLSPELGTGRLFEVNNEVSGNDHTATSTYSDRGSKLDLRT